MLPFIAKRGIQGVVLLIMVSFISFAVMNLAPGNAMQTFINPRMSPQEITRAENALGINKPIPVQYLGWASNLLQGNFGYSVRNGESVTALLKQRAGPTLLLTATSFGLIVCIALLIGVYSAARPYSLVDYLSTTVVFAGISIPSFFFGLTLIYLFSVQLGWFPTSGFESYSAGPPGRWRCCWTGLAHGAARVRPDPDRHRRDPASCSQLGQRGAQAGLHPHGPQQGRR